LPGRLEGRGGPEAAVDPPVLIRVASECVEGPSGSAQRARGGTKTPPPPLPGHHTLRAARPKPQGSVHSAADLLRANAEHAVRGILLPRFSGVQDADAALESSALAGARRRAPPLRAPPCRASRRTSPGRPRPSAPPRRGAPFPPDPPSRPVPPPAARR
jgi:hypothetical protein